MMKMKNRSILLLLGLILIVGIQHLLFKENPTKAIIELQDNELLISEGSFVRASVIPAWLKPTVYGNLVNCLAYHESRHDINAVGQAGEIGELQFMPSTFQQYCVEQFNLRNDIQNAEIQRICCDYMIQDKWNNVYHWTTAEMCL